ncbi:alpha/beta-hydrolase [Pseudohyphozyma bogoriensis]|nr:alpha/beta-hydrolase [Pseudohyphozyma bogoriensis]
MPTHDRPLLSMVLGVDRPWHDSTTMAWREFCCGIECFSLTLDYELFKAGTVLERGLDIAHDPFSPEGRQHLLDQHRQLMSLQKTEYERCAETMGDEFKYMGTSTVVRDIAEMSRVLEGPDAPINFFGGSYGTILGAYLVNMLPEKIGKVLIDGVASSPGWANLHTTEWLHDWMIDTEKTYRWFLSDCSKAGPEACPIGHYKGENPKDIDARLEAFLDDLYDSPMAVPDGIRPGVLNSGGARTILYTATNQPGSWPKISSIFGQALNGNVTALYNALVQPLHLEGHAKKQTDLSRVAVSCADTVPYASPEEWPTADYMVEKTLAVLNDTSRHFGASVTLIEPDGGCQFWPASGKTPERFTGPWNATLRTPMLIVSNTADPITPLASGREINALMGNSSRLLIQNSPGHCSLGSVSVCTSRAYRDYFVSGKLPENEKLCEVDRGYFPSTEGDEFDATVRSMSVEDQHFAEIGHKLAGEWDRWLSA